jgi:hypothetical protein
MPNSMLSHTTLTLTDGRGGQLSAKWPNRPDPYRFARTGVPGRAVCPLTGKPRSCRPRIPANGRQRQGSDQRAGTGPGKCRVRHEPPGARPASRPGTLPRLPGACRAMAAGVPGQDGGTSDLARAGTAVPAAGRGGRDPARRRPAAPPPSTRTNTGSRSPATRCAPGSASPTGPPPACCGSAAPVNAARQEPRAA